MNKSIMYWVGIIAAILASISGLPADTIVQIIVVVLTTVFGITIPNGLRAAAMIELPEKWKDKQLFTAIATVIVILVTKFFGVPSTIVWTLVAAVVAYMFDVAIETTGTIQGLKMKAKRK